MEIERRPAYSAQHGIRFELILIQCSSSDRSALSYPRYATDIHQHVAIYKFIQHVFDYMQARDRICEMMVRISEPLTREQGDKLNNQRANIAKIIATVGGTLGGVVGKAFQPGVAATMATYVGRAGSGYIAGNSALGGLPTYHAGDRIIGVDAAVNGGIGPQRSAQSMLIKSTGR